MHSECAAKGRGGDRREEGRGAGAEIGWSGGRERENALANILSWRERAAPGEDVGHAPKAAQQPTSRLQVVIWHVRAPLFSRCDAVFSKVCPDDICKCERCKASIT
jgi:hypothetical protein